MNRFVSVHLQHDAVNARIGRPARIAPLGCDLAVHNDVGACGLGALEAAKEKGVWGIGVDVDQSSLGPHILTSVLKRIDVAVYEAVRAAKEGRFRGGRTMELGLREGAVGLGRISPRVPRALVDEVERIRRLIVSGKIANIPTALR